MLLPLNVPNIISSLIYYVDYNVIYQYVITFMSFVPLIKDYEQKF